MSNDDSPETVSRVWYEVGQALLPLAEAVATEPPSSGLVALLRAAGVDTDELKASVDVLADVCQNLQVPLSSLHAALSSSSAAAVALVSDIRAIVAAVRELDAGEPATELGSASERLLAYLITQHLLTHHRSIYAFLRLAGLMVESSSDTDGPVPRLDPRRLITLLQHPNDLLAKAHGWGGTSLDYRLLFDRLQQLLLLLGFPTIPAEPDGQALDLLGVDPGAVPTPSLRMSVAEVVREDSRADIGLEIAPLRRPGEPDALAIVPLSFGNASETFLLDEYWRLQIDAVSDSTTRYAVVFAPDGINFTALEGDHRDLRADIRLAIVRDKPSGESRTLLRGPGGSRVETGTLGLELFASSDPPDAGVRLLGEDWRLVIGADPGDGFLSTIFPSDGVKAVFALGAGWSRRRGLHISGGMGLRIDIPVQAKLAVVEIGTVSIVVEATTEEGSQVVRGAATLNATASLGPFRVALEGLGIVADLQLDAASGSAAIGEFNVAAKPPTGTGLALDAPLVTGGGFLADRGGGRYAGALMLEVGNIALSALGLITTGTNDFSLLAVIAARFAPIQLGYGFTLNGAGGFVAVNRTIDYAALQSGLSCGSLDAIMFPRDLEANAPQVLADLDRFFPTHQGRYVFGPSFVLGWGTPTLMEATLGVFLELPAPVKVVLAGRLRATLPNAKAPVVILNIDVLGGLDLERKELSIDASLRDSRLAQFALNGDVAVRARWGSNPDFLLSVGGFNPRFKPPAGLRRLERISIGIMNQKNLRLNLQAYLAVTPATVQFGARVDLYAAVDLGFIGTFAVAASLQFDALVVLSPFSFIVDIHAAVVLKRNGKAFLGLSLTVALSGPRPWRAHGEATFHLLGKRTFRFSLTTGENQVPEPPRVHDVTDKLSRELLDPRNWETRKPPHTAALVLVAEPRQEEGLVLHPLGTLTVRQRVVPLEEDLTHYGSEIPDKSRYTVTVRATDGSVATVAPERFVYEPFCRAHFFDLSDDQKLHAPSFEPMKAGVRLAHQAVDYPTGAVRSVDQLAYEPWVQDLGDAAPRPAPAHLLTHKDLLRSIPAGSVTRNGVDASRAHAQMGSPAPVRLRDRGYTIANLENMSTMSPRLEGDPEPRLSYHDAHRMLERQLVAAPWRAGDVGVVETFEVTT